MTGRGLEGRRQARIILFAAFLLVGVEVLLFVAQPNTMGGAPPGRWGLGIGSLVLLAGGALQLVGLIWMIRIYRADPEGRRSWWRFNRF
jgi:hypothetical protein